MRVLVTGCAGLVGSWVAEALCREKDVELVLGLDDLSGGEIANVEIITDPKFRFHQFDIANYQKLEDLFRAHRPHVVFHAAACAREGASAFQPAHIERTNLNISTILLEVAIKHKVKRFIFTSSMAVMGNGKCPYTEKMRRNPIDVYGINKAAVEQTIEVLSEVHGFEYVIIRPHNIIGPRQIFDMYRNVVTIFINRLMRKEPLYVFGEGHIRAFSYIEDSVPSLVRATIGNVTNEIIFVGGKEPITIEQLLDAVIEDFAPDYTPKIIHLPPRPLEVSEAWCSVEKSIELLGYKEEISWREGVRRTVKWAKEKKGPQPWRVDNLPLINELTPKPWLELGR